jgi:hypothetical protein
LPLIFAQLRADEQRGLFLRTIARRQPAKGPIGAEAKNGMKTTAYNLGALLSALLACGPGQSADPPAAPQGVPPAAVIPPGSKAPLPDVLPQTPSGAMPTTSTPRTDGLPPGSVTSPWIDYSRPDCCGSICGGPIGSEYFLRNGPSIPVSTGILHETLNTGWMTEAGLRTLFFNQETSKAWTVEAGLSYTYNNSSRSDVVYQVPFLVANQAGTPVLQNFNVTTRDYQRWSVNIAAGREWYLGKSAYEEGWRWRAGWDIGGRWGYGRLDLNDLTTLPDHIGFRRTSDVFGAVALSLHQDIEIPLKNCVSLIAGIRGEWVYNWTDIVPPEAGRDLMEVNILLNAGFRY